jgi:hypothetical protein
MLENVSIIPKARRFGNFRPPLDHLRLRGQPSVQDRLGLSVRSFHYQCWRRVGPLIPASPANVPSWKIGLPFRARGYLSVKE